MRRIIIFNERGISLSDEMGLVLVTIIICGLVGTKGGMTRNSYGNSRGGVK